MQKPTKLINGGDAHILTKEDRSKGGKRVTQQKKYSNLVRASARALCKNCPAICILKQSNLEKAKNFRCSVPDARAKSIWYNMPIMNEDLLEKLDRETLLKLSMKCNSARDLKLLHDCILNKKKIDYPKAQKIQIDQRIITLTIEEKEAEIKRLLGL